MGGDAATLTDVEAWTRERLERAWPDARPLLSAALGDVPDRVADLRVEPFEKQSRSHDNRRQPQRPGRPRLGPRRAIVLLGWNGTTIVAKLLEDDRGRHAHELQAALWQDGFAEGPFRVPRALAYLADHHVAFMDAAPGSQLWALAEGRLRDATDPRIVAAVAGSAAWLAAFHRWPGRLGEPLRLEPQLLRLARDAARVGAARPDHVPLVEEILALLAERLPPVFPSAVQAHLDYGPHNVVADDEGVTIIDFNSSCPSDPGWDVASFLISVAWSAPVEDWPRLEPLADAFLEEYVRRGGPTGSLLYCLSHAAGRRVVRRLARNERDQLEPSLDLLRRLPAYVAERTA